mgnify:CR=1 FL=1
MSENVTGQGGYEILVGLRVVNEERYQAYRDGMTPILVRMGGAFRYDMRIEEVIRGHEGLSRVFVMSFPDKATKEAFFADEAYLAVREEHFDPSVETAVIIAEYAPA